MKQCLELAVARRMHVGAFVLGAFVCLALAPVRAHAQVVSDSIRSADSTSYHPQSLASFAMHTIGPVPLLRSAALAGFDQWRRQPVTWMQTSTGFRDRLDSRLGGEVLGHTIRFAFERAAQEQPTKYHGCECEGVEPRLAHALLSPLRVDTPHGQQLSAVLPLGVIVSALAVTSVHPGGFSLARGLESGAGGVASAALTSAVKEFWPWHWRPPGL